ncbi:hypothetical protein AAC387_Pa01g1419 [Persea americana]
MDKYEKKQQPNPRKPSFSSTLLDAIYRSTKHVDKEGGVFLNRETTRKKQSISISHISDGFHKLQRNAKEITETFRPKQIRTGSVFSSLAEITPQRKTQLPKIQTSQQQKPKQETFNKAIDLKKKKMQKPPISPGGRVASFFNSLFKASATPKKANGTTTLGKPKPDCSSSTPLSSCLCKAPSSRGNSLKSVRFYPVSVIFDEDCKPCGQKRIDEREHNLGHRPSMIGKELSVHVMEKTRRVEEAARELLHGDRKKSELLEVVMRDLQENGVRDDFDDGTSCSSSDLFELESLAVVSHDRYREELPVYEKTRIDTNRAIAHSSLC